LAFALFFLAGCSGSRKQAASAPAPAKPAAAAPAGDFADFADEFGENAAASKPVSDPLSGYNRAMFKFNDKFYFWFGKPVSRAYGFVVPEGVRVSINRAFTNMMFPLRFACSLLQFKFKGAASELGRFVVNSTLGIGGLFDPAADLKWRPSDEDLGQVLGHWGVGPGWPFVLPFLGQTNVRDGLTGLPSYFANPAWYFTNNWEFFGLTSGEKFNFMSLHGKEYEKLRAEAIDPYLFFRDAHLQYRQNKVKE
jgi:phospholipid-binding lipoprotein MlaA